MSTPIFRPQCHRLAFCLLVGLAACAKTSPQTPTDDSAQVELALGQTPADVGCVVVTIATDKSERRRFDVKAGTTANFTLARLPVGVAVFSVDAFGGACSAGSTTPLWNGGPLSVTLKAGANGSIVVVLWPTTQATVVIGFSPGAAPICAPSGSACTGNGDCCSRACALDLGSAPGVGLCRADEPPADPRATVKYQPPLLLERKARASYPAFDGDNFFVSFPRLGEGEGGEARASQVRDEFVVPALLGTGFDPMNLRTIQTPGEAPITLPEGKFGPLLTQACGSEREDPVTNAACSYLELITQMGGPVPPPPQAARVMDGILGMPAGRFSQEATRALQYFSFSQRERGVPIEHKGVMAIKRRGQRVSAVFGAVLNRYRIVNEVLLNADAAVRQARISLSRLERVDSTQLPPGPRGTRLVLLPYGEAPPDPSGLGGGTALRFAYRTMVGASRKLQTTVESLTYSIWVDAATGDLLKYVAETAGDSLTFNPWCRDPSAAGACPRFNVDPTAPGSGMYDLTAQPFKMAVPGFPSGSATTVFPSARNNEQCLEDQASRNFRTANAFAHLSRARTTLVDGGIVFPFDVTVLIDDVNSTQNTANFGEKILSFTSTTSGAACPPVFGGLMAGSQDATIITHEYAHLVTMQLQNGKAPDDCGATDCAIGNPYNRRFFHDYADGVAAMLTDSPCIGGWSAKNKTPAGSTSSSAILRDAVASACAQASEGPELPRLLYADDGVDKVFVAADAFNSALPASTVTPGQKAMPLKDAFPTRRTAMNSSAGEYGDGQLVGAALWHLWQGVKSQSSVIGAIPVWGRLNQAILATGFAPTVCPVSDSGCDMNVYRAGRDLLLNLSNAWAQGESTQSLNKVMSAFARTGIFLVPPTCIDGDVGAMTGALDPTFCPDGKTGADAIVDFDDGDKTTSDTTTKWGTIRLADDDFAKAFSADKAKFRIWTGPAFSFIPTADPKAGGTAVTPAVSVCNDSYQLFTRAVTALPQPPLPLDDMAWDAGLPQSTNGSCYVEADASDIVKAYQGRDPAFVMVQYKVKTWRGGPNANPRLYERDSTMPGARLFSNPPEALAPSAFFITEKGRAF